MGEGKGRERERKRREKGEDGGKRQMGYIQVLHSRAPPITGT